jgi:hypothetical protein
MVTLLSTIVTLLNQRKSRALRLAEASLPPSQFWAFRRCFLDEFGREGLEGDLERLLAERERGTDRAGRYEQRKEVPRE